VKAKAAKSSPSKLRREESLFQAEAAYAYSVFRDALGDSEGSINALKRALEAMPTYAPAILSMGSVEYQLGRIAEGRELFESLLALPKDTTDICEIIDEAGTFLARRGAYKDGLALYRKAVGKFPDVAVLFEGLGYCAGHAGLHEEAISAHERAVELEPENQKLVNDLGWTLLQAGRLPEARKTLERAVAMDPTDELAGENLRFCRQEMARRKGGKAGNSQGGPPSTGYAPVKRRKPSLFRRGRRLPS
jgi:tetratricopeptide (TPR) repeat protein